MDKVSESPPENMCFTSDATEYIAILFQSGDRNTLMDNAPFAASVAESAPAQSFSGDSHFTSAC